MKLTSESVEETAKMMSERLKNSLETISEN